MPASQLIRIEHVVVLTNLKFRLKQYARLFPFLIYAFFTLWMVLGSKGVRIFHQVRYGRCEMNEEVGNCQRRASFL